jgi:hypothetical protein
MEVRLFPNMRRPGVGLKPRRESQRPLLPQHARHCPVLEAGSALGFLVFPPLEPHESFLVEFNGDGQYRFTYFLQQASAAPQPLFVITLTLPLGSIGPIREEVEFMVAVPPISRDDAKRIARSLFVVEDLNSPPGAVTLRGATSFQTPQGWDTVYAPVLNMIERPMAPMLVIRVETDWYPHETEFRYVLQPGEGIGGAHTLPIGQVFFVPREEVTLRDGTEAESATRATAREEFAREKAAHQVATPYGLKYSPHYLRESREHADKGKRRGR